MEVQQLATAQQRATGVCAPIERCPAGSLQAEDVEGVKDLVDDYVERNQEDFEDFTTPDDL